MWPTHLSDILQMYISADLRPCLCALLKHIARVQVPIPGHFVQNTIGCIFTVQSCVCRRDTEDCCGTPPTCFQSKAICFVVCLRARAGSPWVHTDDAVMKINAIHHNEGALPLKHARTLTVFHFILGNNPQKNSGETRGGGRLEK